MCLQLIFNVPFVQVDQSLQGNSGHYNTLSEYDSGYQFNGNYDVQQSFQGYSEYFNPTSDYSLANQSSHWFSNLQQQQVPYSAPYQDDSDMLRQVVEENWPSLVDERTYMREDSSHYRPKNPITGILPGDSSDDDTDSTVKPLYKRYNHNLYRVCFESFGQTSVFFIGF